MRTGETMVCSKDCGHGQPEGCFGTPDYHREWATPRSKQVKSSHTQNSVVTHSGLLSTSQASFVLSLNKLVYTLTLHCPWTAFIPLMRQRTLNESGILCHSANRAVTLASIEGPDFTRRFCFQQDASYHKPCLEKYSWCQVCSWWERGKH
jgi:hypothetical protein